MAGRRSNNSTTRGMGRCERGNPSYLPTASPTVEHMNQRSFYNFLNHAQHHPPNNQSSLGSKKVTFADGSKNILHNTSQRPTSKTEESQRKEVEQGAKTATIKRQNAAEVALESSNKKSQKTAADLSEMETKAEEKTKKDEGGLFSVFGMFSFLALPATTTPKPIKNTKNETQSSKAKSYKIFDRLLHQNQPTNKAPVTNTFFSFLGLSERDSKNKIEEGVGNYKPQQVIASQKISPPPEAAENHSHDGQQEQSSQNSKKEETGDENRARLKKLWLSTIGKHGNNGSLTKAQIKIKEEQKFNAFYKGEEAAQIQVKTICKTLSNDCSLTYNEMSKELRDLKELMTIKKYNTSWIDVLETMENAKKKFETSPHLNLGQDAGQRTQNTQLQLEFTGKLINNNGKYAVALSRMQEELFGNRFKAGKGLKADISPPGKMSGSQKPGFHR